MHKIAPSVMLGILLGGCGHKTSTPSTPITLIDNIQDSTGRLACSLFSSVATGEYMPYKSYLPGVVYFQVDDKFVVCVDAFAMQP